MLEHVHISRGVTKLGVNIPSVNLPPVMTCRPDAQCFKKCYARKGRFAFARNKDLLRMNMSIWLEDPQQFERDVLIAAFHCKFFRWHSAGDIPDIAYLEMMVRVASSIPETKFLCFTKKYEMVNEYLSIHKYFPGNLRMVFSAWGSFIPENPYNLPMAYVRFKNGETDGIPAGALQCKGYCGECTLSGSSCWTLNDGASVVFDEH